MSLQAPTEKIDFCEQEFSSIEEMAGHGFILSEIAEVMAVDPIDRVGVIIALNNKRSEAHRRYRKGFLQSQLKLRQRIFLDAQHGSSPAQAMAVKILDEAEYNLYDK